MVDTSLVLLSLAHSQVQSEVDALVRIHFPLSLSSGAATFLRPSGLPKARRTACTAMSEIVLAGMVVHGDRPVALLPEEYLLDGLMPCSFSELDVDGLSRHLEGLNRRDRSVVVAILTEWCWIRLATAAFVTFDVAWTDRDARRCNRRGQCHGLADGLLTTMESFSLR